MKTLWLFALTLLPAVPAGVDTPPRYRLTVLPLDFSSDTMCRSAAFARGQTTGAAGQTLLEEQPRI